MTDMERTPYRKPPTQIIAEERALICPVCKTSFQSAARNGRPIRCSVCRAARKAQRKSKRAKERRAERRTHGMGGI